MLDLDKITFLNRFSQDLVSITIKTSGTSGLIISNFSTFKPMLLNIIKMRLEDLILFKWEAKT